MAAVQGERVGGYEIGEKLAEGGMGAVYRAKHQLIGKSAAVKVLLPELSTNQEVITRFFNEAKAATAVRHPGIVEIFDFGYMPNGMAYIVMELLDGEPLSRRLARQGRLSEHQSLSILRGIASALAAAHDKGIVHRDLKPDNVFMVPDPDMAEGERPKLLDFGIAKIAEAQRGETSKTRTGAVMGTPTYMSPEQCKGAGSVDHRSDLYALGCILYEMLTGRPPFQAQGVGELIGAHLFMEPDPPTSIVADISPATEQLTLSLLNKEPEDRVQTARELTRLLGHATPARMSSAVSSPMASAMPTPSPVKTASRRTPVAVKVPTQLQLSGQTGANVSATTTLGGSTGQQSIAMPVAAPAPTKRIAVLGGSGAILAGAIVFIAIRASSGAGSEPSPTAAAPTEQATEQQVAPALDAGIASATATVDAGSPAPEPDAAVVVTATIDAGIAADAAATTTTSRTPPRLRDRSRKGNKRDDKRAAGSGASTGTKRDAGVAPIRFNRGD